MAIQLAPGSFYGQTPRLLEAAGFAFAESIYQPPIRIPPHAHVRPFFYLVLEGLCIETSAGRTRTRGPSTLVFHPAGQVHTNQWQGRAARCFHVEVPPVRLDGLREDAPVLDQPADFDKGLLSWLVLRLYREYERMDQASPLALEGLALEVLAEMARPAGLAPPRHVPRWLGEARTLLHDRFAENPTLSELGAVVGVHPAHLARAFRQHHGCSVGTYLRRLRVEYACRELAATARPLADIALAAGFADQSHFTRIFRRHTGTTPAEFRRAARPGA
jgi:AraC family transcriptional regulator